MGKTKNRQLVNRVTATVADQQTRNLSERSLETFKGTQTLVKGAQRYKNVAADQRAGRIFEDQNVLRFNQKSAEIGRKARAVTTDLVGQTNHPTTDIIIKNGHGKIVKTVQAKTSRQKIDKLERMVAAPKYKEQDVLLTPSDKAEAVKKQAIRLAGKKGPQSSGHSRVAKNTKGYLEHGGIKAKGVNSKEVQFATAQPRLYKFKEDFAALTKECHTAGNKAGCAGAAFGAGSALIEGFKGDKETEEIIVDMIVEGGKEYAVAYTSAVLAKGGAHVLQKVATDATTKAMAQEVVKKSVLASAPKVLLRGNAHIAFAAALVQAGVAMGKYLNGDLSKKEMLENVSQTAVTGASAFYYGLMGQVLIPIPVVGALVGSTVGFLIGNLIHKAGLVCLGDNPELKAAKERRKAIEAMVQAAIPKIKLYRTKLKKKLKQYLDEQAELFDECLDGIGTLYSINNFSVETFLASCEALCTNFGSSLQWKNQVEFDTFMKHKTLAFVL